MMGWSPRCYIPSFVKIGLQVLEKKIFEVFFTIYGRGDHPGNVTQMPQSNFLSPYPRLHIKFGFDRAVVSEKMFEIVDDLRRRTTEHGYTISSPTSLQLRGAKNPLFSLFPIEKPKLPNLSLS